jgi:hypothetical protein
MRTAGKRAAACLLLAVIVGSSFYICMAGETQSASTPGPGIALSVITGMVVDQNGKGIAGARVSLYNAIYRGGKYVETGLAGVDQNPQETSGGSAGGISGLYQFNKVPAGLYAIWVETGGTKTVATVNAVGGTTQIGNIVVQAPIAPTVEPSPGSATPAASPAATVSPAPGPGPSGEGGGDLARGFIAAIVALQLIACGIVLALYAAKRI